MLTAAAKDPETDFKSALRPNPPQHTNILGDSQIHSNVKDIQEVVDRV
jgi:hypothetical protein